MTPPRSAVDIIVAITKAAGSKQEAIEALQKLARGQDGVTGTDDDVIPQQVVDVLAFLIENDVASDIVNLVATGAVGTFTQRVVAFVKSMWCCAR